MVFVGKLEGKRTLERPKHRWKDRIRMYLREIGWGVGGCSEFTWPRIGAGGRLW
jgi:hypothetical protein